ncbi:IPT/TIG domain-containing protein [Kitasatospora sp. NPDC002551]|uniref:IPT/TIG domain-containing protein n=1 Tax=unclassified Kitasatospora TaxID=2633591 RepID=UPI003320B350
MTENLAAVSAAGVTMTLAAIAATGAASRPSGETLAAQRARVAAGVTRQLADPDLATGGTWELEWLALSPYNANMAYIAKNVHGPVFAVVVRGTTANVTDLLEDLDVGTVVPFTAGGSPQPVSVSKGAMTAFTEVVGMTDGSSPTGSTLVQALTGLFAASPTPPAVYVIGHSLGGCVATMLALYLQARTWDGVSPTFGVITFAAPTAGLQDFADYFGSVKWTVNLGYANDYDLVPLAWSSLDTAKSWYPAVHGPVATDEVKDLLIPELEALTGPNTYAQPDNTFGLNPDYDTFDGTVVRHSTADFFGQAGYQHANSTYLDLLQAPLVPAGPVVTAISPTVGDVGTPVVITGSGFGPDSVVDFGTVPGANAVVDGANRITVPAPAGAGIVEVRVTGTLGTSPAVPFAQFAYGGPAPVLVTALSRDSGTAGTTVDITGVGFAGKPTVYFGRNPSASVTLSSPTRITATAPASGTPLSRTVDVRVLSNGYLSPASPADEFTYPGLLVE